MKTKTVRIAVAVNDSGQWNAAGWEIDVTPSPEETVKNCAFSGLDAESDREHLVWITAEIPIPEVAEVEALAVEVSGPET